MARNPRLPTFPSDLPGGFPGARATLQAVAFWVGVLLPLAHVPLLLLVDHGRVVDADVVAGLLAVNAVACIVGHGHEPSRSNPGAER